MNFEEKVAEIINTPDSEIKNNHILRHYVEECYVLIGGLVICAKKGGERRTAIRALREFVASGKRVDGKMAMLKTLEIEKPKSQFSLKGTMYVHELGEHFNNNNITDEKAIAIIKANHKRLSHFDKYPDNIDELLNGKKKEEPKKEPKKIKAEVIEEAPLQTQPGE